MRDESLLPLFASVFLAGLTVGFFSGAIVGELRKDYAWTRYVIENGAMEWHCDSKTGETVLRWKE